ncbi:FkbM family methyltransferase [Roseomonas sp. BN140053]|uniref:FkbM family methyltransferase n=1 Tax=Roseomonas sp. BN140053 TaxID=3391898 RepID=UPI0039EC0D62
MQIVSSVLNLASRLGGPRMAFQIQLLRWQRWKNVEREWLLLPLLADRSRVAVDVGANLGLYAGRLAQLCRKVHCFEPIPWLADDLATRLPRRGVVIHQIALSDRAGTAELRIPYGEAGQEMHGLSTLEDANSFQHDVTTTRLVDCRVERLDAVVEDPIGFIKVDVEGHELAVLRGAVGILRRDRPTLLIESQQLTNPDAPASVFDFLGDLGYAGYFYERHQRRGIAEFDIGLHQHPREMRPGGLYVNNFIFTATPENAARLPPTLD